MSPVIQPYFVAYGALALAIALTLVVYLAILHHRPR
jgi:hypothetical protein